MQTANYTQCSVENDLREYTGAAEAQGRGMGAWEWFWYRRETEPSTGNKPARPLHLLEPMRQWSPWPLQGLKFHLCLTDVFCQIQPS